MAYTYEVITNLTHASVEGSLATMCGVTLDSASEPKDDSREITCERCLAALARERIWNS